MDLIAWGVSIFAKLHGISRAQFTAKWLATARVHTQDGAGRR